MTAATVVLILAAAALAVYVGWAVHTIRRRIEWDRHTRQGLRAADRPLGPEDEPGWTDAGPR